MKPTECMHNFIPIASFTDSHIHDVEHNIRWCSKCGAVKKEQRMDGRVLESKTVHYTPNTRQ